MSPDLESLKRFQERQSSLVEEIDSFGSAKYLLTVTVHQTESFIRSIGLLYDLYTNSNLEYWISEKFPILYPYLPGFLILRNKKPLIAAITYFRNKFDLTLIEGAGRQHPRKFGLACEIGVDQNIPVIGVIKRSLWGDIDFNNPINYSLYTAFPVFDGDDKIAYFVKKAGNKKGIFISVGNKISLTSALEIILPTLFFRLPEPIRLAKALLKTP
ncbi:MAG: endonuclease V [Candidatus Hodarchaeota archaeon]